MKRRKPANPNPEQRKAMLEREYGASILSEIAYSLKEKCRSPFNKDGTITKEGKKAALAILDNLIYACGDEEFFDDITEDVLSTYRGFNHF